MSNWGCWTTENYYVIKWENNWESERERASRKALNVPKCQRQTKQYTLNTLKIISSCSRFKLFKTQIKLTSLPKKKRKIIKATTTTTGTNEKCRYKPLWAFFFIFFYWSCALDGMFKLWRQMPPQATLIRERVPLSLAQFLSLSTREHGCIVYLNSWTLCVTRRVQIDRVMILSTFAKALTRALTLSQLCRSLCSAHTWTNTHICICLHSH